MMSNTKIFLLMAGLSGQFMLAGCVPHTTGEFFLYGIPASIILMLVVGFAALILWPLMGMPVTL